MRKYHRFSGMLAGLILLLVFSGAGDARTRKGDKLLAEGKKAEQRKEWDRALDLYEQALSQDPADVGYRLAAKRVRFQAGQAHVDLGQRIREQGDLDKALAEFEKAYAIDPGSIVAEQELKRTAEMIERNKKAGAALTPAQQKMTPAEIAKQQELDRISRIEGPPELKPISKAPINLKMTNQPARVLFETVGKLAGINVVFDPDYGNDPQAVRKNISVDLNNASLEDALDYLSTMTRSFWKPLSANAIFITQDTVPKRRDYEDSVVKVFYLSNLTTPQELQEIMQVLRMIANLQKVFQYNSMNALVVRGSPDTVALAEKLINDLDKPKAEVIVDVIVMEADRNKSRNLAAAIASLSSSGTLTPGLNSGINFTPRNPVLFGDNSNVITTTTVNPDGTKTTVTTPVTGATGSQFGNFGGFNQFGGGGFITGGSNTPTQQLMSLARIGHISTNDFSVALPGALLQAVMSDGSTKVLQSPQIRASSGQKASLRLGDKVPIASGGLQPFGGQVGGFSSLYNQFQFQDVGVNVDLTPTIHSNGEVTLKLTIDISSVRDHVDIGGISQPIIGQRKVEQEIRVREGEASLIGGLMQDQDTKSVSGVPGMANIPILRRLFTSESVSRSQSELLIALVPHIIRTPGISEQNVRAIAAGTEQINRLSFAPKPDGTAPAAPGQTLVGPPPAPGAAPQQLAPGIPIPSGGTQPAPTQPAVPGQPAEPAQQPAPAIAQPAATHLLFRPWEAQVQAGSTFTLQFDADNARDLMAAPFHLKFDPQVLRLQEVRPGPLLSSDGQKIIFTRNILNDTGDATVNLNRLPGTAGVHGSGTLAVFTFQAIKPGQTMVTFSELQARDSQMQAVSSDVPRAVVTIK